VLNEASKEQRVTTTFYPKEIQNDYHLHNIAEHRVAVRNALKNAAVAAHHTQISMGHCTGCING
jgi:hypothetical protein